MTVSSTHATASAVGLRVTLWSWPPGRLLLITCLWVMVGLTVSLAGAPLAEISDPMIPAQTAPPSGLSAPIERDGGTVEPTCLL